MNNWIPASVLVVVALVAVALGYFIGLPEESLDELDEPFSAFDLVSECDLLAAHPSDAERTAEGVTEDEIVPKLAIIACQTALEDDPTEPRYAFQLGRALLAVNREEEARAQLVNASNASYAAANAYLGDIYQFGLGAEVSVALAKDYYEKAAALGFEPAKAQLEQINFEPSLYISKTISAFYSKDFGTVTQQSKSAALRNYVYTFVQSFANECELKLDPPSLVRLYRYRYPEDYSWEAEMDNVIIGIQTEIGESDAGVFVERHGCEGPVAKTTFANINEFFAST